MNPARLRAGELLGSIGAIGLFVCLWLDWFDPEYVLRGYGEKAVSGAGGSGWGALGWLALVFVVAALVLAALWLTFTVAQQSPAFPVAGAMWTFAIGTFAVIAVLLRIVFAPDGTDTQLGAYLGLAFAIALPLGAFLAIKDERTKSHESRAVEPAELRPIPGRAQPSAD